MGEHGRGLALLIKYAALLCGLLVVLAFGVRPALRQAGSALLGAGVAKSGARELASAAATASQTALKPPEPVEVDPERIRSQEIFEQVTDHVKREPTKLAPVAELDPLRLTPGKSPRLG